MKPRLAVLFFLNKKPLYFNWVSFRDVKLIFFVIDDRFVIISLIGIQL